MKKTYLAMLTMAFITVSFFNSCKKADSIVPEKNTKKVKNTSSSSALPDCITLSEGMLHFSDWECYTSYINAISEMDDETVFAEQEEMGFTSYAKMYQDVLTQYAKLGDNENPANQPTQDDIRRFQDQHRDIVDFTDDDFDTKVKGSFQYIVGNQFAFIVGEDIYYVNNKDIIVGRYTPGQVKSIAEMERDPSAARSVINKLEVSTGRGAWVGGPVQEFTASCGSYRTKGKCYFYWTIMPNSTYTKSVEYRQFVVDIKNQKKGWFGIWYANALTTHIQGDHQTSYSAYATFNSTTYTNHHTWYFAGYSYWYPTLNWIFPSGVWGYINCGGYSVSNCGTYGWHF